MQDALFKSMSQQAEQACQANLSKAKSEAETIVANARVQAKRKHDETVQRLEAELNRAQAHARHMAQIAVERDTLSAKHAIAEDVLARSRQALADLAQSDAFAPVLEGLLATVIDACKQERGSLDGMTVYVPNKHVAHIQNWLSQRGEGNVPVAADVSLSDGAAIQDAAQTYRVSHTLSGRLERLENKARSAALSKLFGGTV